MKIIPTVPIYERTFIESNISYHFSQILDIKKALKNQSFLKFIYFYFKRLRQVQFAINLHEQYHLSHLLMRSDSIYPTKL